MKDNVTHISNPNVSKVVFDNFDKIFYLLIIVAFIITYDDLENWQIVEVIKISAVMVALLLLSSRLLKRVIHSVNINWGEKKLVIFFYKTKKSEVFSFDEVQKIKVNGAIYLKINGKTKLFSTEKYSVVLPEFNRIRKIQWGKYCNVLGPNKEIRDKIDQELSTSI